MLLYSFAARLYSPFNRKAKQWVEGRKGLFDQIEQHLKGISADRIWIHCSSLGEFEQAVPVIVELKKKYSSYKIILTFFSASGYEQKKNTGLADAVFYLPLDTPGNARKFIKFVNPRLAIYVKYEFWYFYISELKRKNIPLYIISARFRNDHIYFKWYGSFFRKILLSCTHIFVQNESSLRLLKKSGINNASVSGDTRYDRVKSIAAHPKDLPLIHRFCNQRRVIVGGSTWPEDESLIAKCISKSEDQVCWIIAPHEISENHLQQLEDKLPGHPIRLSKYKGVPADILIIDSIGLLSSVYQFAMIAYVGGAFRSGLHNILEPAAYHIPVIFGNRISHFAEAQLMVENGTGFSVTNHNELCDCISKLLADNDRYKAIRVSQEKFIEKQSGAVEQIIKNINLENN